MDGKQDGIIKAGGETWMKFNRLCLTTFDCRGKLFTSLWTKYNVVHYRINIFKTWYKPYTFLFECLNILFTLQRDVISNVLKGITTTIA